MHLVADGFLAVGRHRDVELDGLAVEFLELVGIFQDIPGSPAVKVLDDADVSRRGFVIAHLDFEGFVDPAGVEIGAVFGTGALAGQVEGVAGIETDSFILGRVVDVVLAGKLELAVIVAAVETHPALRQGHAEMVL